MRKNSLYRSFKSEESPAKQKTLNGLDAIFNTPSPQSQKKFFDIQYIFEDPMAIKPKRYQMSPKIHTNRSISKNYKTIEPQADMSTSVILKSDEKLLRMQPVQEKQLLLLQKTDLSFNKDNKNDSIHARRFSQNSSIMKSLSVKKTEKSATIEAKPFQTILSSKNYSFHREKHSVERQKRRTKVERQIKKLQTNDVLENGKTNKKILKIESEQFRKYCEKNIVLAKNAFLLKHKQTIRIYRPWSPIGFEEGELQFGESL